MYTSETVGGRERRTHLIFYVEGFGSMRLRLLVRVH
jgi:hypothetical protein